MKPGAWWPIAIVGVLAVTVGANVALMVAARDPNAYVVEPDYYRKAVNWDSTMAQARASVALGWQVDAALRDWTPAGTPLRVQLADSTGAPLTGAAVRVELINNLSPEHAAARRARATSGAGRYEARVALPRPGPLGAAAAGAARRATASRRTCAATSARAPRGDRARRLGARSRACSAARTARACAAGSSCFYAGQDGRGRALGARRLQPGPARFVRCCSACSPARPGTLLDRAGAAAGLQRAAAVAAGAIMVVWGGVALSAALGARLPAARGARVPARALRRRDATPCTRSRPRCARSRWGS